MEGTLIIDGRPVSECGIVFARTYTGFWKAAQPVWTPGGRLVTAAPAGDWDIILVGAGFARVVLHRSVVPGQVLDLGTIPIHHGHVVVGTVSDDGGRAIAGAKVKIKQSYVSLPDDELTARSRGDFSTVSDSQGRFRIDDVTSATLGDSRITITATADGRSSRVVTIPNQDVTIALVVADTGEVDGVIDGADERGSLVLATSAANTATTPVNVDGSFAFRSLVPGSYTIRLSRDPGLDGPPPQQVIVSARTVKQVRLTFPPSSLTVMLVAADPCVGIRIREAATNTPITSKTCVHGSAEINGLRPGHYRACVLESCTDIEVVSTPQRQTFTVGR